QVWLYTAAVLIPLAAFVVELLVGRMFGRFNAFLATGAIATSCVLSLVGLVDYMVEAPGILSGHHAASAASGEHAPAPPPLAWAGSFDWVELGQGLTLYTNAAGAKTTFGLAIPLGIYIDSLAVIMFAMVTFIATLIHIYSIGYMHGDPRFPRF